MRSLPENAQERSTDQFSTASGPSVHCRLWELVLVLLGILPAFSIAVLANSQSRWTKWLEKMGGVGTWGTQARSSTPAAVWRGQGLADFGDFCVRDYDPVSGLIREASFKFQVATAFENREEFDSFIRSFGYIIRDEVLVTVRASNSDELQRPDHLGRKILTRVNRLLGREVLKSAHLNDFVFMERSPAPLRSTDDS